MNEYKELYILYCADLNKGYSRKDVKKHNNAMKKLGELFHKIKNETDKSFLAELLQVDDKTVASLVAAHCLGLGVYIPQAKKVLKAISKNKNDLILAFDAKATLDVWKQQGYLDF